MNLCSEVPSNTRLRVSSCAKIGKSNRVAAVSQTIHIHPSMHDMSLLLGTGGDRSIARPPQAECFNGSSAQTVGLSYTQRCLEVSTQGRGVVPVCAMSSLCTVSFQFADHTAPPCHNIGYPFSPTRTGR